VSFEGGVEVCWYW